MGPGGLREKNGLQLNRQKKIGQTGKFITWPGTRKSRTADFSL